MSEFVRDLRYAARLYRKSAGFAVTTTLLLALGISANTVIFSVIEAAFLRKLPVSHPDELVRFVHQVPGGPAVTYYRYPFYAMLRDRKEFFSGVMGQLEMNLSMRDGPGSERIRADLVTGNFFELLGVKAQHGRVLAPQDERLTGALPLVLSHAFWMRRFNGDRGVIGHKIWLQGRDAVIVGITPPEFNGMSVETTPDVRAPLGAAPALTSDAEIKRLDDTFVDLVGRLRPGVTTLQAQAGFVATWNAYLNSNLSPESKNWEKTFRIELQSAARGVSRLRSQFSSALIFLMAASGLLLLIVCANVAGLLMARSAARWQEMAVRAAVGASRGRLVRQMLSESALLTVVGGAGGLLLAFASMPLLPKVLPPIRHLDATSLTLTIHIGLDFRILGFSLLLCALTTVLFGLGPAIQVARRDLYGSLRASRSSRRWTGRHAVVVAQIALCTFLIIAAGLLLATFERLRRMDAGFDRDRIVTFSVDPETRRYSPEQARAVETRLVERVRALPGVDSAAIAIRGLMRGTGIKTGIRLPGQPPDRNEGLNTSMNYVSPDYFSVMGMRLVAGRNYRDDEPAGISPRPRVVNEAFARHFFPGLDPIGRIFGAKAEYRVIGVVSDAKYRSLREPVPPTMYLMWNQSVLSAESFILHVRTRTRPESIIGPVQEIMRAVDPELPFYEIKTLASEVDASLWSERLVAALASVFATLAVLLAAIGIYSLLSYDVARRTPEIGIRMALGARPRNIFRLISSQAAGMVVAGVALGVAGAVIAAPSIRNLLYEIPPNDLATLTIAGLFVTVVAFAGAALPAIRAARVEPASALRYTISC